MILMWLGSFVLVMFGLTESQKHLSALFAKEQKSFLDKGAEQKLTTLFARLLGLVALESSPRKSLYTGLALYNLRIQTLRPSVLHMALSSLGAWWALFLANLYLGFNGFFLLGLCVLGFFPVYRFAKMKLALKLVFSVGLFLIGGELMLRNSSIIQTTLGTSELAFFLADGRFSSVLVLLAVGILLSLFVQIEFWSLMLALGLLVTNTISFNGALALVAGERVGMMILFWWRSRKLNQDCQRIGLQLSLVSILGAIIGFFLAGETRTLLAYGFSFETSGFQDKSFQFVLLTSEILLVQWLAQMIWGHFGSRVKVDEMQEAHYFPPSWFEQEILSAPAMQWAKDKVHKRLSEIRYHLQGLNTLQEGQVPGHIQARLREEEHKLSSIVFKDVL
ncbi:hypothetical protein ACES2L_02500 [Bdellovibrio bacteriovorus]